MQSQSFRSLMFNRLRLSPKSEVGLKKNCHLLKKLKIACNIRNESLHFWPQNAIFEKLTLLTHKVLFSKKFTLLTPKWYFRKSVHFWPPKWYVRKSLHFWPPKWYFRKGLHFWLPKCYCRKSLHFWPKKFYSREKYTSDDFFVFCYVYSKIHFFHA